MSNITDDLRALHREVFLAAVQGLSNEIYKRDKLSGFDEWIVSEARRVALTAIEFWPDTQQERDEVIAYVIKEATT